MLKNVKLNLSCKVTIICIGFLGFSYYVAMQMKLKWIVKLELNRID